MDMAHILGGFGKWAATLLLFGFSIVLSLMFFQAITPPDKPWFAWAALGLTEGGLALWMIVFRLMRHEAMLKAIAIVMVVACAVCSVTVAGTQFYLMLATHYDISANPQIFQLVSIMLEVMFGLHMGAFLVEMIADYFSKPENTFRGVPSPTQSRYHIAEERTQPKEERTLEQRSTRQLSPARSQGSFWQSLTGLFRRQESSVLALPPAQDDDTYDEMRVRQQMRQEREAQERQKHLDDIRARILAEEQASQSDDEPAKK